MNTAAKAKELVVEANNRIGLLSEVAGVLYNAKINMESICCYCMGSQATFMLIVDKHAAARKVLAKAGFKTSERPVVRVDLSNKPGELAKAAARVSAAGVDIEYLYATASGRGASAVFKTRNDAKALKALKK